MKKKFLILSILLFVMMDIYSQNNADKEYLSFTIGPSFPVGGYAKKIFKTCHPVLQKQEVLSTFLITG